MEKVFQEASAMLLFQLDRVETAIITIPPGLQGRCHKDYDVEKYVTDIKEVAEIVNTCSTKLTLVRKSTPNEKISNFVEICSEFTGGLSHLVDRFLALDNIDISKPLFKIVAQAVKGLMLQSNGLIVKLGRATVDEDVGAETGKVWNACEDIKKLPVANRIAYRREIIESCSVIKDTKEEFEGYLQNSENLEQSVKAPEEEVEDNDDDDDDDDDDDYDEITYNQTEKIVVKKCLDLIDTAFKLLKVFLQNMPNYKEDIRNIVSIKQSVEQIEKLTVNAAAELYPPLDATKLQKQSQLLFDAVKAMKDLLCTDDNLVEGLVSSLGPTTTWIQAEEPWNINNALFDVATNVLGFSRQEVVNSLASNGQNVEHAAQSLLKSLESNKKI